MANAPSLPVLAEQPSWMLSVLKCLQTPTIEVRSPDTGETIVRKSPSSWAVPRSLPEGALLRKALARFDEAMQPCGREGVRSVMLHLAHVTMPPSTEGMNAKEIRAWGLEQTDAYALHLQHLPLGIIVHAAKHWADTSKWWPKPAELLEIAEPVLVERQLQRERLAKLIENLGKPRLTQRAAPEPASRDPEERCRDVIRSNRRVGRHGHADELETEFVKRFGKASGVPEYVVESVGMA